MDLSNEVRSLRTRRRTAEFIRLSSALALIVMSLVALAAFSMEVLSATRAYVNGEALWSKNQKEAVLRLTQYANTHSESYYVGYLQALRVPLGDRVARVELSRDGEFDREIAQRGFLDGGNHPDDVSRLIWLFRYFHQVSYLRRAILIWEKADYLIEGLANVGEQLHADVAKETLTPEKADRAERQISRINGELTPLENAFSQTLGEAARQIEKMLFGLMAIVGGVLIVSGVGTCKKLLGRIQEYESRYRSILDTAGEAIFLSDASTGTILESNRKFEEMVGEPAQRFLGTPQPLLPIEGTGAGFWSELVHDLRTVDRLHREMGFRRANGDVIPVDVSANLADADGRLVVMGIVRDVTLRKQTEEALRSARDSAIDASRVKGMFLANMSHEVRTPLNGVIGMISALGESELDEEQREYVRVAGDSAESLLHVVNDILDFSKIEAGRMELCETPFDLRAAINRIMEMPNVIAQKKGLRVSVFVDPNLPREVIGDSARLGQILTNLISNAIKFTETGTVELAAVLSRSQDYAERIHFDVRDTGIGISPDVQEKLFEAFTQADGTVTRKYGGTGLGLAISKQLAYLMKGEIGVRSELGRGSTFWFNIPFKMVQEHRPPSMAEKQPETGNSTFAGRNESLENDQLPFAQPFPHKIGGDLGS